MADYTYATMIVADADKAQAQADMGDGFFLFPLSADGSAPATHWMSSGPFNNSELEAEHSWPRIVVYGEDWQAAIVQENLQPVIEG